MTRQELTALAERRQVLKAEADLIAAELAEVETAIKNELDAQGVTSTNAGNFTIKYTPYEQTRLDSAALKKADLATWERFAVKVQTRRFSITANA